MVGGTGNYSRQGGRKRLLTPTRCKHIHRKTGHIKNHPPFSATVQPLSARALPTLYRSRPKKHFFCHWLANAFLHIFFYKKQHYIYYKIVIYNVFLIRFPLAFEKGCPPFLCPISTRSPRVPGHCGILAPNLVGVARVCPTVLHRPIRY